MIPKKTLDLQLESNTPMQPKTFLYIHYPIPLVVRNLIIDNELEVSYVRFFRVVTGEAGQEESLYYGRTCEQTCPQEL